MNETSKKILAYLFSEAGAVDIADLAKYFSINKDSINQSLDEIVNWQTATPFVLVRSETDVALTLTSEMSQILGDLDNRENERELSKAALETLSVILYKNGATRADIDYVRGVNSSFSLRSLVARGYVVRSSKNTYVPTAELLIFLGISTIDDLPDRETIINKLNEINNASVN